MVAFAIVYNMKESMWKIEDWYESCFQKKKKKKKWCHFRGWYSILPIQFYIVPVSHRDAMQNMNYFKTE